MISRPDHRASVVVVSLPGMMQQMLTETFAKRPDVDVVGIASGGLSALAMIRHQQPDLVVIDSNLPETETDRLIEWIKESKQAARTLVLVETTQQTSRAASAGADYTLRSYMLPDHLDTLLGMIKPQPNHGQ